MINGPSQELKDTKSNPTTAGTLLSDFGVHACSNSPRPWPTRSEVPNPLFPLLLISFPMQQSVGPLHLRPGHGGRREAFTSTAAIRCYIDERKQKHTQVDIPNAPPCDVSAGAVVQLQTGHPQPPLGWQSPEDGLRQCASWKFALQALMLSNYFKFVPGHLARILQQVKLSCKSTKYFDLLNF